MLFPPFPLFRGVCQSLGERKRQEKTSPHLRYLLFKFDCLINVIYAIYLAGQLLKAVNLDNKIATSHLVGFKVASTMRTSMLNRGFASHATNKTLRMCTILDPR